VLWAVRRILAFEIEESVRSLLNDKIDVAVQIDISPLRSWDVETAEKRDFIGCPIFSEYGERCERALPPS
jgi:hypothetical protein